MTAGELVDAGRIAEGLAELEAVVRREPANPDHRVFLFQLLSIAGDWARAWTHLRAAAQLNPKLVMLANTYGPVLEGEVHRATVFRGGHTALLVGDPEPWIAALVEGDARLGRGEREGAVALLRTAYESASVPAGRRGDQQFAGWLDADSRLGPVLELFMNGKYYWAPFSRMSGLSVQRPVNLHDLAWVPATVTWSAGGETGALIPVRYPGTEAAADGELRLARRTDWSELAEGLYTGLGHRTFLTDSGDVPLLEVADVVFEPAA